MAWAFGVLVEAREDGTADATVSTGSFSFAANRLLLVVGAGMDQVGATTDVTMTTNTTGLTFTDEAGKETVTYSIGGSAIRIWAAKTGAGGSGSITITSSSVNNTRSVHVIEVDGADLDASIDDIIVEWAKNHTVGTGGAPINVTLADLAEGNAAFCGSCTTIQGHEQDNFTNITNDDPGASGGATLTGFSETDAFVTISGEGGGVLGGAAGILLELKGFAPPTATTGAPADKGRTIKKLDPHWYAAPHRFRNMQDAA